MNKKIVQFGVVIAIIGFIMAGCSDLSRIGIDAETLFNEQAVVADAESLTTSNIVFASGDTADSVTEDFTVSASGDSDTTITWSSSDTDVISVAADGKASVTRPTGSSVTVTLTATITKGDSTTTKSFTVTVLAVEGVNNTITFESLVAADGADGTADTTMLTLTFSGDPTTLTADNITVTGATKGALTGTGTTRTLALSGITVGNGETVSVAITSPSGFTISGSPKTVMVYKASLTPLTLVSAWADGSDDGGDITETTKLQLNFDVNPTTLTAADITITGATKGALTAGDNDKQRYIAISDITVANGAKVSVVITSPSGFTIPATPKEVTVYKEPTSVSFDDMTANGVDGTTDTTMLTLTFSKDPSSLNLTHITVSGATKVALRDGATDKERYLDISDIGVGNGGNVWVTIASPDGFKMSNVSNPKAVQVWELTYLLGDTGPAGGFIFYINPNYVTDGWRYLEAAPASTQVDSTKWSSTNLDIGGTSGEIGHGKENTELMVTALNNASESNTAAQLADGFEYGGCSDWFLPSSNELNEMKVLTNLTERHPELSTYFDGGPVLWSSNQDLSSKLPFIFDSDNDDLTTAAKDLDLSVRFARRVH